MRPALAAAAALLAAAAAPSPPTSSQAINVIAEAIPLKPADPAQARVGELTYAWGARLKARGTSRFSGLSALEVDAVSPPVGERKRPPRSWRAYTALTDDGDAFRWVAADDDPQGAGLVQPLTGLDGARLAGKSQSDAEGLTATDDGYLASFEGRHRIWAYRGADGFRVFRRAPEAAPAPVVTDFAGNMGFEALALLPGPDGGTLAVGAEDGRLWLCPRAETACALALRGAPEFGWWLTGLDSLPGTPDLIGLYRFYNPFTREFRAMIAYLPVRDGRVRVIPLARLAPPLNVDNFESIAAERRDAGFRLYIVSDDDFSASRRTLLLAFDWPSKSERPASPPVPDRKS